MIVQVRVCAICGQPFVADADNLVECRTVDESDHITGITKVLVCRACMEKHGFDDEDERE